MAETIQNQEAITYGTYVSMETIICYKCAIPFAVPAPYKANLRATQEGFYCPSGHVQYYTKSTETILRERLDVEQKARAAEVQRLKSLAFDKQTEADNWRKQWENQLTEKKKVAAKLKRTEKRIANGVCPCCNRTFKDLAAHMKTKHPESVKK